MPPLSPGEIAEGAAKQITDTVTNGGPFDKDLIKKIIQTWVDFVPLTMVMSSRRLAATGTNPPGYRPSGAPANPPAPAPSPTPSSDTQDLEYGEIVCRALTSAIEGLEKSQQALLIEMDKVPSVRIRPRTIRITKGITWPTSLPEEFPTRYYGLDFMGIGALHSTEGKIYTHDILNFVHNCSGSPRKILRAVRRIQYAARWCDDRRQGIIRARENLFKAQGKALRSLEAEAALKTLRGIK